MKGELTPDQQIAVLSRIWGNDRDGYVFLPTIDGRARDAAARRKGYHEGRAFEWPREKDRIKERLQAHQADDVYFTPALFNAKRRSEHVVEAERSLWADLDPVDPNTIVDYRPTVAWETSPGRYQAVWLLDRPRVGASWASKENHRLTLHLNADPGGWDATQLLRVPGRPNHKPDYGDSPVPGSLLWDAGPRYSWEDFDDLPEVGVLHEEVDLLDEELLSGIDRHEIWARVRLKVSKAVREYVAQRRVPEDVDRSEILWQIERELADAGCSVAEIVAVVRSTVWNKYEGRQDELRRLKTEAAKAVSAREDSPLERTDDEDDKPKELTSYEDFARQRIPKPRWLVDGIWTEGACGFIAGAPKSYKSRMALDLAVSVASGSSWLGRYRARRRRKVLYLQEEDDARSVSSRIANMVEARAKDFFVDGYLALGASEPPTPVGATDYPLDESARGPRKSVVWTPPEPGGLGVYVEVQKGFVASDETWQGWLVDHIQRNEIGLVIIDTLGTVAGELDTDRSSDLMPRLLKPLKTIAHQTEAAICLVHHNRKSQANATTGKAGSEMLGSVALYAWVDCGVYARTADRTEPDGSRVVSIQTESKEDTGEEFRISIPKMFANVPTGERRLWDPEVVVEPQDPGPTPEQPPPSTKETRGRGARATIAKNLRLDRGPRPVEVVDEVLGAKEAARWVRQGYLVQEGSKYRWTEAGA